MRTDAPTAWPTRTTAAASWALVAALTWEPAPAGRMPPEPGRTATSIVTTFYPLQFVTQRVAGDRAQVTNLTKPGAEPHDLELTPREVASFSDASLVVYLAGFQPAVDEASQTEATAHALDVAASARLDLQVPAARQTRLRRSVTRTSGSTRPDWQTWPTRSPDPARQRRPL